MEYHHKYPPGDAPAKSPNVKRNIANASVQDSNAPKTANAVTAIMENKICNISIIKGEEWKFKSGPEITMGRVNRAMKKTYFK